MEYLDFKFIENEDVLLYFKHLHNHEDIRFQLVIE